MTTTAIRLATLTIAACVAFSPMLVRAAGGGYPHPPPPADSGKSKSKEARNRSSMATSGLCDDLSAA